MTRFRSPNRTTTWLFYRPAGLMGVLMLGLICVTLAQQNRDNSNLPPSPINHFRGLLTLNSADQEAYLSTIDPTRTEVLRRKLGEYSTMPRQERELRLRQLEICRWVYPMMLQTEPARRNAMASVPIQEQDLVTERLQEWDRLTSAQQNSVMQDKTALSYFFRPEPAFIQDQRDLMKIMPPELKVKLENELAQWRQKSATDRDKMRVRLDELLQLQKREREEVIATIEPESSSQLRSTLGVFLRLTPEQRHNCIEGFSKLANLSEDDRRRFLLDAARWQALSPQQRELWRVMVMHSSNPSPAPPSPLDAVQTDPRPPRPVAVASVP